MTRLLFLCSKNRWRSPTAEEVFASCPGVECASAGVSRDAEVPRQARKATDLFLRFQEGRQVRTLQDTLVSRMAAMAFACTACTAGAEGLVEDFQVTSAKNFGRLLARATNAQAMEFALVFKDTAFHLAKTNPDHCMKMVMPSVFGPLSREDWPAPFLNRQMAMQRKVAATAMTAPNPAPAEADAGPIFDKVFRGLKNTYGADAAALLTRTDKNVPPEKGCLMWGRLYEAFSKLPVDQGGTVVRWLNAP